ncbi:MAG: outer membrane beta-barrel protein [Acidobacteriaceae bacterium]
MGDSPIRILTFLAVAALGVGFAPAHAQTDVAASIYGSFSGTTNGNNTIQSPANQAGGMLELRHIANPILGFEATYSFNRANERYSNPVILCPGIGCTSIESVSANAHEITADWVPSLRIANLRPFGVLGLGLLLDVPASSQATVISQSCAACVVTTTSTPTQTSAKAVYVYGAGLDWGLLPHIGLRLQYRGNLYQAPNLTKTFTSTSTFLHTSEPMLGAYVRF